MIPQHWPSFWLGLIAWPFVTIAGVIVLVLLFELSDAMNRFEHDLRQWLAAKRGGEHQ